MTQLQLSGYRDNMALSSRSKFLLCFMGSSLHAWFLVGMVFSGEFGLFF